MNSTISLEIAKWIRTLLKSEMTNREKKKNYLMKDDRAKKKNPTNITLRKDVWCFINVVKKQEKIEVIYEL